VFDGSSDAFTQGAALQETLHAHPNDDDDDDDDDVDVDVDTAADGGNIELVLRTLQFMCEGDATPTLHPQLNGALDV
jgi:hypothetical protein